MSNLLITLTTDFGYTDPFVGIMKGVIYGINPAATIVDLTHGVPAQDVLAAALILRHSVGYFPRGSIHVAVVDPGVGSSRKPLLIESEESFFVGPDNGIWSLALENRAIERIVHLSNDSFYRKPTSSTFHGRDIFTPVAAHLSLGVAADAFGEPITSWVRIELPTVQTTRNQLIGEIVYIDGFGNLFTNIRATDLRDKGSLEVQLGDLTISGIALNYAAVASGAHTALVNSWGLLEIAANKGNAQQQSGAVIGDRVLVQFLETNRLGGSQ